MTRGGAGNIRASAMIIISRGSTITPRPQRIVGKQMSRGRPFCLPPAEIVSCPERLWFLSPRQRQDPCPPHGSFWKTHLSRQPQHEKPQHLVQPSISGELYVNICTGRWYQRPRSLSYIIPHKSSGFSYPGSATFAGVLQRYVNLILKTLHNVLHDSRQKHRSCDQWPQTQAGFSFGWYFYLKCGILAGRWHKWMQI